MAAVAVQDVSMRGRLLRAFRFRSTVHTRSRDEGGDVKQQNDRTQKPQAEQAHVHVDPIADPSPSRLNYPISVCKLGIPKISKASKH